MPDKPTWCGRLDEISAQLRDLPEHWVDRTTLQGLLGIGARRAQQILAPCVVRRIGSNGVADRDLLLAHLHRLAAGDTAFYECQRRRRLAEKIQALDRERTRAVLVEAPAAIARQELAKMPEGVSISPGLITVQFSSSREALEKLLALAMAIGNDPLQFERLATGAH